LKKSGYECRGYYPLEREDNENGDYSHIVYWRVKLLLVLGYFTAECKYLFRRTQKSVGSLIVVLDESIHEHAQAPKNNKYVRVEDYNTATIFKQKEVGKVEILLKYLTPINIKMPIPQSMLNWGASVGLNRYLEIMKKAIMEYKELKS